jgi:putative membrane protein
VPEVLLAPALVALATGYLLAARRSTRAGRDGGPGPVQIAAFLAGIGVLLFSLGFPLDRSADDHLSAHMVQHVLLVSVAAPLLVAGSPRPLFVRAPARDPVVRPSSAAWVAVVAATAFVSVATLLIWHVPALYDAALHRDPVHAAEHLTLLGTAMIFWRVLAGSRDCLGAAVLALFVATLPVMVLGVALTLARSPWYPVYVDGSRAKALSDQQLAGVIMWGYGGVLAVVGAVLLFAAWLRALDRSTTPPIETPRHSAAATSGLTRGGAS